MQLRHATEEDISIRWITASGLAVRTAVRQEAGDAPPLLILNGIGAGFELLLPFIDLLHSTEVIIFDMPGAGKSAAPVLPWRLRDYARVTAEVMDQLHCPAAAVLGLSWGGAVAQQFAKQYPQRCVKLILAATSPGHAMVPGRPGVLMHMSNPRRYWDRAYLNRIAGNIYGGSFRTNKLTAKQYAVSMTAPSSRGYYYQLFAMFGWSSLPWLHTLKQPTLVLQGIDDPLIPKINGRLLAAMIPDARLVEVNCGHLFLITRAVEVSELIGKFVSEQGGICGRMPDRT